MVRGRSSPCVSLPLTQFVADRERLAPQSQSALHFFSFFFTSLEVAVFILHTIIMLPPLPLTARPREPLLLFDFPTTSPPA